MAGLVVLDAGVIIALFNGDDLHHGWAKDMFVHTADQTLAISSLTYAEVLVHPTRAGRADVFESSIAGLKLEIRSVDPEDARRIALLRSTTALKMPDAVVLHLAASTGGTLATTDRALAETARKLSLGVLHPE